MLENLKIALQKQKKLILIFFLTVFIPALSLSIFGIRAIKNERFRQAKQLENEHRRTAERIRSRISAEFRELDLVLQNLAESPAFKVRDEKAIADLVRARLADNPLIETAFYFFETGEPRFPTFHPAPAPHSLNLRSILPEPLPRILSTAQEQEFTAKNYKRAITLYQDLGRQTKDQNIQAQVLYNEARCLVKLERYAEAIEIFQKVDNDYPEAVTASGLPLALAARLQTVHCYRVREEIPSALRTGFELLEDIIRMRWTLSEAQFKTYTGLVEEALEDILAENPAPPSTESWPERYARLKTLLQDKNAEWAVIVAIQEEIVPDLRRRQGSSDLLFPIRHSKTVGNKTFLILATPVVETSEGDTVGLFGLKIKEDFLLNNVLAEAGAADLSTDQTEVVVSVL